MKYKNIVFDFGNVIVKFNDEQVLGSFCSTSEDFRLMKEAVFHDWDTLDSGQADYDKYMEYATSLLPDHLHSNIRKLAKEWYRHLTPLDDTWKLIHELKARGFALYILSNAPTYFAEHASYFDITKEFDGIVFSGPIKMLKPEPGIYQYLFDTYDITPEECLFLDDKEENIRAGEALGMDGIVFDGDVQKVIKQLVL